MELLPSSALLLQPPYLVLDAVDLRLNAADLVRDLLGALAVAGAQGLHERGAQLAQLMLEPSELATQLHELRAGRVVRPLAVASEELPLRRLRRARRKRGRGHRDGRGKCKRTERRDN